jgi:hypothetical protein
MSVMVVNTIVMVEMTVVQEGEDNDSDAIS